jgi:hypothetical protein
MSNEVRVKPLNEKRGRARKQDRKKERKKITEI